MLHNVFLLCSLNISHSTCGLIYLATNFSFVLGPLGGTNPIIYLFCMNMANKAIIILTTVSSKEEGERIAAKLVGNKLAACVNILPKMTSIYRWENKINKDDELLLIIKTAEYLEPKVYDFIRDKHSYEVPEIITLNIQNIDKKYSEWLNSSIDTKEQW